MDMKDVCKERVAGIVLQHPKGITAAALCERLVDLGWAYDNLTPRGLGFNDDDILIMKR